MRALVIGGTSGIGYGIARSLAKEGCNVTISGRSKERGEEIVGELKELSGNREDLEFGFVACNSFLIKNIKQMTDEYKQKNDTLDILVLTQGMATIQGLTETPEGIDEKLALHYYGRFAYILFLLPLLRKSTAPPKVLSVLSGGVHSPYAQYATDPMLKTNYSLGNAANAAGFYNDLAVDTLSKQPENSNITFIHSAPGFVRYCWSVYSCTLVTMPLISVAPIGGLKCRLG
jgi:NAD(P)-dependent dehydrogenase (short-subunit alcohol dehydrogenase family)